MSSSPSCCVGLPEKCFRQNKGFCIWWIFQNNSQLLFWKKSVTFNIRDGHETLHLIYNCLYIIIIIIIIIIREKKLLEIIACNPCTPQKKTD